MAHAQAIIITCPDPRLDKPLQDFCENVLNLYAIDWEKNDGGVKNIFAGGEAREKILEQIGKSLVEHGIERVILINHTNCQAYGGSARFASLEQEIHAQEIQLRHAVSVTRVRFPRTPIEAYLIILAETAEIKRIV